MLARGLMAFMLIATGSCQTAPIVTPTQDDARQITLAPGESRRVDQFDLAVTFEAVIEDSRCPTGVTCITEGDAAVRIRVDGPKQATTTYTLHTSQRFARDVMHGDVVIHLESVTPYPAAEARPRSNDYRLTLSFRQK